MYPQHLTPGPYAQPRHHVCQLELREPRQLRKGWGPEPKREGQDLLSEETDFKLILELSGLSQDRVSEREAWHSSGSSRVCACHMNL